MEVFYVNTPQLYTYTFSLSIPLSQNALRRLRFNALSEAVQIPATGERRSERDRERYRTAVPHGIATESEGRYRLARLRGDRRPSKGGPPPLQGGSYVAFKAPLRRARSTFD